MYPHQPTKNNDWHRADVVAGLHKRGWSLRALARAHQYASETALNNAFDKPYPKAERIIADALGLKPEEIWPSRYAKKPRSKINKSLSDCRKTA